MLGKLFAWLKPRQCRPAISEKSQAKIGLTTGTTLSADRPQRPGGHDRLGFRQVAQELASCIAYQSPTDGYVISIEGEWGSGKTTLVNFLADELSRVSSNPPEIVRFEPWVVGDRNGMLSELMSDLSAACEKLEAEANPRKWRLRKRTQTAARKLKKYASKLGRATAPLAQLVAAFDISSASAIGTIAARAADSADAIDLSTPIDRIKKELVEALNQLPRKMVVIVDDLDRLEPPEVVEVLRLIRAVADFPNVIYVLSYDHKVLTGNLKAGLGIPDGASFLKKMVQVSFRVPLPEAFDLRRWFTEECIAVFEVVRKEPLSGEERNRLQEVCSIEGGLLKTPRDIARVLNAIRLNWVPVSDKVNFVDMVWLQITRLDNEGLYRWLEEYLVEFMAVIAGASVTAQERTVFATRLSGFVTSEISLSPKSLWRFRDFVPGVKRELNAEPKDLLFDTSDKDGIGKATNLCRLGSPQHYRYYFAFTKPAGALDDQELFKFIASAESGSNVVELCRNHIRTSRPQGGTMMSTLVDRLLHLDENIVSPRGAAAILVALSSCMDDAARAEGKGEWGRHWIWVAGTMLVKRLLPKLAEKERHDTIAQMFGSGEALGWLMCELIRDEIFAHGRYGGRAKAESEWLLSEEQLDKAIACFLPRLQSTERENIVETPEVLSFMFGWRQLGDNEGVSRWVDEQLATDDRFVRLMDACRSWRSSSNKGLYYPLNPNEVGEFLDFDAAVVRLHKIESDDDTSPALRRLAMELIEAAKLGRRD
jgi:type II secretory pathway predicted ATPase ExeA